jgi:hypothetical protein
MTSQAIKYKNPFYCTQMGLNNIYLPTEIRGKFAEISQIMLLIVDGA